MATSDIRIDGDFVTLNSSDGNQDLTITGIDWIPRGCKLILQRVGSLNTASNTVGAGLSIGYCDGAKQVCGLAGGEYGGASAVGVRANAPYLGFLAHDDTSADFDLEVRFVSFIEGGVRVNLTYPNGTAPVTAYLVLYGGEDYAMVLGVLDNGDASGTVSGLPFQPTVLEWLHNTIDGATFTDASETDGGFRFMCAGFAADTGVGGIVQHAVHYNSTDNATVEINTGLQPYAAWDTTGTTLRYSLTVDAFNADGFDWSKDAAMDRALFYAAHDFGDCEVAAGLTTLPSATNTDWSENLGIEPQLLCVYCADVTAAGILNADSRGVMHVASSGGYLATELDDHGNASSWAASLASDRTLFSEYTGGGSPPSVTAIIDMDLPSLTATGWTASQPHTATQALVWAYWAVEIGATPADRLDVKAGVTIDQADTTLTTPFQQDITLSGFGTPKACIVTCAGADGSTVVSDPLSAGKWRSIGFFDGATQINQQVREAGGQATTDSERTTDTGYAIRVENSTGASIGVISLIADGIRIAWEDSGGTPAAPDSAFNVRVELFGGSDYEAEVAQVALPFDSTPAISEGIFTRMPDAMHVAWVAWEIGLSNDFASSAIASYGFACRNPAGLQQACLGLHREDGVAATNGGTSIRNDAVAGYPTQAGTGWARSIEITGWSAEAMRVESRAEASEAPGVNTREMIVLAHCLGSARVEIGDTTLPANASTNYTESALSWQPQYAQILLTEETSVPGIGANDGYADMVFTASTGACYTYTSDTGAGTSDVAEAMRDGLILATAGPETRIVDIATPTMTGTGWQSAQPHGASTAVVGVYLAIEQGAGPIAVAGVVVEDADAAAGSVELNSIARRVWRALLSDYEGYAGSYGEAVSDIQARLVLVQSQLDDIEAKIDTLDANVDSVLADLPSATAVADAVWDEQTADHDVSGSFGRFVKRLLTFSKFLSTKDI